MKTLKTQSKAAPSRRRQPNGGGAGADFRKMATALAAAGRAFYARGWALGTSGNFSAVLSREPLRLAITSTGLDKGSLTSAHFLEMDDTANVLRGEGKPSAEA